MIVFIIGYLLIGLAVNGFINTIPLVRENKAKVKAQFKDNMLGYRLGTFFGFCISTLVWPLLIAILVVCFIIGFVGAAMGLIK